MIYYFSTIAIIIAGSVKAELPDLTLSLDTILRVMQDSKVPVKIAVLDACRDNPFE
jgi:hypothetical protein